MGRYQVPRRAQESEEKKRREEGQNYDRRPIAPFVMHRKPTLQMRKRKDQEGYTVHDFNAPVAPETFHKLTRGKYKMPRGT